MINKIWKTAGWMCLCSFLVLVPSNEAVANQVTEITAEAAETETVAIETSTEMLVKVDVDDVELYNESNPDAEIITILEKDSIYQIEMTTPSGWLKVSGEAGTGYINGDESITMVEMTQEESSEEVARKQSEARRNALVEYALQFVGGRYVYGGNDPHTGVDCSGFSKYVMQHGAGVSINRSAAAQALQGQPVSADAIRPGDLIFYSTGKRVDHVGMYIGDGKIVHASTERTGIKISNWDYKKQVAIRNMLGD